MAKTRVASLARQFSQLRSAYQLLEQPNRTVSRGQNGQQQRFVTVQRPVSKPQQFDAMGTPNLHGKLGANTTAGIAGGTGVMPGDKEAGRSFPPKDTGASSTEREHQEITSKEAVARWLASSKERSSTEQELPDLSGVPWFSLNKETAASERERLEVSMQRLALMSKMGDNNQASNFTFLPPKNELLRKYFHWENLASPQKHKVTLAKVRNDFQIHKTDCGSSQVQIALLTTKIKYMTKHMETHRKDYHSRKGLEAMVQRRRKILKYLRRKDWDAYCEVITKLGLRDNVMDQQKR